MPWRRWCSIEEFPPVAILQPTLTLCPISIMSHGKPVPASYAQTTQKIAPLLSQAGPMLQALAFGGAGRHGRRPRSLPQPRRRLPQGITWALPTDEEKPKEQTSSCATLTLQSMPEFTTRSKQTAPALHSAEQTLRFYLPDRQQFVAKGKARCSLRLDIRMVPSHSLISAG